MMHELSFRFQKPVEIGYFMGYNVDDIIKAADSLGFY